MRVWDGHTNEKYRMSFYNRTNVPLNKVRKNFGFFKFPCSVTPYRKEQGLAWKLLPCRYYVLPVLMFQQTNEQQCTVWYGTIVQYNTVPYYIFFHNGIRLDLFMYYYAS